MILNAGEFQKRLMLIPSFDAEEEKKEIEQKENLFYRIVGVEKMSEISDITTQTLLDTLQHMDEFIMEQSPLEEEKQRISREVGAYKSILCARLV